jgi:hypothetical protein
MQQATSAPPDRASQDVGNIVLLEHFNCTIPDQRLATLFYVTGLGGTRDPFIFTGLENMWVNFGRTQVHLPSPGASPRPQRLRGTAGFVLPDLALVAERLEFAGRELQRVLPGVATQFVFEHKDGCIEARCPWGNRIRCHAPAPEWGLLQLGLVYLDFDVLPGTAEGIARFYKQVLGAPARAGHGQAVVQVGTFQTLRFTETDAPAADYDGHHLQVYLADFSSPHRWLRERGLLTRDRDPHEWRFEWICDPQDGRRLFQVEHEVRSLRHPLFARPLVNRDQKVTNSSYRPGLGAFTGVY